MIMSFKNKRGDFNFLLMSLILALIAGGVIAYRYSETNGTFLSNLENIGDVTTSCQNYCYSLQTDNYCHSTFNLKYEVGNKKILLKDITCNFLSSINKNNPLSIEKCESITCNDVIIENNQDEYKRQEVCYNNNAKVNRVYSLNNNSIPQTLESTKCLGDKNLECSSTANFKGIKISINSLNDEARKNVFNTLALCVNSKSVGDDCWQAVNAIYKKSNVVFSCVYSDLLGKKYTVSSTKTSLNLPFLVASDKDSCLKYGLNEIEKLNLLQTGDIISYIWDKNTGHNAIFIEWVDKKGRIAKLFDWNGPNKNYRYYEENLSDLKHPVYMIWMPKQKYSISSM
ncbi:hypothetical protein GYA25_00225 [Candidatus Woesearchaeota archaeon]|nr:hypothetical protein [Candidatus Woesearchaeota archaeon]